MPITKKEAIEYIKSLPTLELTEFIQDLQRELGVVLESSQPVQYTTIAGAPLLGNVDSTEYEVILLDVGPSRIETIKTLRALTGLGLAECKYIIENLPKRIKEGIPKDQARDWTKQLHECGATTEVKKYP